MERLPTEICLKILCFLDHQNLATVQLGIVIRGNYVNGRPEILHLWKWRILASEDTLWSNLFEERWGIDRAKFYAPVNSKSWKDVYIVQDRCDRIGLGLKILREGDDCYLVHQGEIQRHLGSRKPQNKSICNSLGSESEYAEGEASLENEEEPCLSILDRILFFMGDLEAASGHAKRRRAL